MEKCKIWTFLKSGKLNLILEILRLDVVQFPDDYEDGAFFTRLVADAKGIHLYQPDEHEPCTRLS